MLLFVSLNLASQLAAIGNNDTSNPIPDDIAFSASFLFFLFLLVCLLLVALLLMGACSSVRATSTV